MPTTQRIKGTLLLARMKYLRSKGSDKVDVVLTRLSADDQKNLRCMLLPSSWYALGLLRRFENAMASVLDHASHDDLFLDIGRAAATANLTEKGAQRVYVTPGDPHFLLKHAPGIYASYFSFGHRTYERADDDSAIVRTTKPFSDAHPEECLITRGWLTRAIEIAGGERVWVEETECGLRGAPHCAFRCRWSPPAREARSA